MTPINGPAGRGPDPDRTRPPRHRPFHRRRFRHGRAGGGVPETTTVWACGQGEHHLGSGPLADWLHTAIAKIVRTYTRPGHRVLILTPPTAPRTAPADTPPGRWHSPRTLYAGLTETAWIIQRLGRSVRTHTAGPTPELTPDSTTQTLLGRPVRPAGPAPDRSPSPPETAPARPAVRTRLHSPQGRFDLIITAAWPRDPRWLAHPEWTELLTPTGTLTVITHSDRREGVLVDPTSAIVRAAARRGLRYLDHAALLETPIQQEKSTATPGGLASRRAAVRREPGARIPVVRVHSDLLVFTASTNGHGQETSDA
ncbi:hypothetical protein M8C13_09080 [Crossiella sp. SN42]|uniref:hypothetical protein n=1 Tax=Crossiella sp. SN42 TaxID=2944808 RepID=UPI00207D3E5C|nr:hypothetical protein [Crossiella sp. SN42]MCO1575909.1 hypothetical protein [Crossiella sp. SN42]